jgi:hypothetical protein
LKLYHNGDAVDTPNSGLGPSLHLLEVTRQIDALFCSAHSARYGPYERIGEGAELLRGRLYRFAMLDPSQRSVALQVFTELERIGGQLWEQEVRVLLRVSAVGHPALPRILDGGYDESRNLAFVVTERPEYDLTHTGAMDLIRQWKADAVRHLGLLADALSFLHGQGLMHRNLWPGTVEVVVPDTTEPERLRLRLARFEMSALVSNFLRRVEAGAQQGDDEVRELLLGQGGSFPAYCPPERLGFLYPDVGLDTFETDRSDVYGLGVLAWNWFVGPLPDGLWAPVAGNAAEVTRWAVALRDHLRGEPTRRRLPRAVLDLLEGMLQPDPRTRLTSADVVERITRQYDALLAVWEPIPDVAPLVAFMPKECKKTVFVWHWIDHDPETPEGRVELKEFLERELRGAELVYSPAGADGFVTGYDRGKLREARFVLLGHRGVWFCNLYEDRNPFGRSRVFDEVLLIRFVAERPRVRSLEGLPYRRRLSMVDVVPSDIGSAALDHRRLNRPSWRPKLDAVRISEPKPEWRATIERAFDWLLDYQDAVQKAREYPFQLDVGTGAPGMLAELIHDSERDHERIHRDTATRGLLAFYATGRPGFGDFFAGADDEAGGRLEFCPDDGRPYPRWRSEIRGEAFMQERLDAGRIRVRVASSGRTLPKRGWLRLAGDAGTEQANYRQREARAELAESPALLAQLHRPTSIRGLQHRWRDSGRDLRGRAIAIVKDMLVSQTFYALHGPPGTGKTTVAAHAVEAFLRAERGARILVSAQSNFALDNLAYAIRRRIGDLDTLIIRITSRFSEEKVDPRVQDLLLKNLVPRLRDQIIQRCNARLGRRTDLEPLREVVGLWRAAAATSELEFYDRIRRGANLVLATCVGSTRDQVDAVGSFGVYDWVIVEEAAKAWPTELVIPLVRGIRWTLIGDHFQLGAHERDKVEEFLGACARADDPVLQTHGEARSEYARIFDLFGTLFEGYASGKRARAGELDIPLERLDLQFRMRRPIAEVVSRAFYPAPGEYDAAGLPLGTLETDPSTEVDSNVDEPAALRGQALVWLDTEGIEDCRDRVGWTNFGEVRLVASLLAGLRPAPRDLPGDEAIAILTPYRAQMRLLGEASLPTDCYRRIFSIDEFQGREADIVIVSLVRDTPRSTDPRGNIGFLAKPERVNVLFSRARRLLVIVGRFRHFHESDVEFWRVACDVVRREGRVLPAADVVVQPGEG